MKHAEIVLNALQIAEEYEDQDLKLTLRQMYYQFVARGLLDSGQKIYKKIGVALTTARYNGTFPVRYLLDRGREVHAGAFTTHDVDVDYAKDRAEGIVKRMPEILLNTDRWFNQPKFVSVWVEKQALEGIFEPVCADLGVSWFACKGYPSVSALSAWLDIAKKVENATEHRLESIEILYFGDHDPDGFEIPRSAERNIQKLRELDDNLNPNIPIKFTRMALNMKQIKMYSPPPFDAKITSSRYNKYVKEHSTNNAWELDALEPSVLRDLIIKEVEKHFDPVEHETNLFELQEVRAEFRRRVELK